MAPSDASKARVADYVKKNKQVPLEQNTLGHQFRLGVLEAEKAIYRQVGDDEFLDYELLKTEAGKTAYKDAFRQEAMKYALSATGHEPTAILNDFKQARVFNGTFGFDISEFDSTVDQYEDRFADDAPYQLFAQHLDARKRAIGAVPLKSIKPEDAEAVIDYTNSSRYFDVTKLEKVRDLAGIINEFERNKIITPNFLDRLERQNKPFLKPGRRIWMPGDPE